MRTDTAMLIAHFGCLLVFGTSYDWSTYHYGLIGLMLAAIAEPEVPVYSAPVKESTAVSQPSELAIA